MNYFMFHLGDWDTRTRVLSPTEKGVYIDLITLYYTLERPLMRSECERIARGYAQNERDAQEFVLDRFFEPEGDAYRNSRCDEEIARANEKTAKAAKSARARWDRVKKDSDSNKVEQMHSKCTANALQTDMRTHSERTANAMLSNTPLLHNSNKSNNPLTPLQGEGEAVAATAEGDEKPKRKRAAAVPRPADVSEEVWEDFKTLRKAKRAPITATAISGLRKEAEKAGLTLEGALRVCIKNGWQGFEASWVSKDDRSEYLPNSRFKRQECRNYDSPI